MSAASHEIAQRAARYLHDGEIVNLGIGIPTLIADYLPDDTHVCLQTENGMLGVGPTPAAIDIDANLVNAGKLPVSEIGGASYFSSAESFAMIRGGHIDVAVLGALQVDERGCIANWSLPGRPILGVGGAMDLLAGARRVIVTTTHLTRDGLPKLVPECSFPLTGNRRVDLVVTEHATFAVEDDGLVLVDVAPDSSVAWIAEHIPAAHRIALQTGAPS